MLLSSGQYFKLIRTLLQNIKGEWAEKKMLGHDIDAQACRPYSNSQSGAKFGRLN